MTKAEAFHQAWQLGMKADFSIVDEIYQGVSPEGAPLPTMLSKTDDAFIVNSFSKYFGMTGWRLGWLIVPDQAVDPLIRIAQNLFICPSVVAQAAAVAAFREEAIEEARDDEDAVNEEDRCDAREAHNEQRDVDADPDEQRAKQRAPHPAQGA